MANNRSRDVTKNMCSQDVVCVDKDLKAYYKPAVKFFEILLEWEMEEVHEKDRKSKKVQTSSQFKNN